VLPLDIETREAGDRGMPVVFEKRQHPVSKVFRRIADELRQRVEFRI